MAISNAAVINFFIARDDMRKSQALHLLQRRPQRNRRMILQSALRTAAALARQQFGNRRRLALLPFQHQLDRSLAERIADSSGSEIIDEILNAGDDSQQASQASCSEPKSYPSTA